MNGEITPPNGRVQLEILELNAFNPETVVVPKAIDQTGLRSHSGGPRVKIPRRTPENPDAEQPDRRGPA